MNSRYSTIGLEAEFEPASRGRVLRNKLGIHRIREMQVTESSALEKAQERLLERFSGDYRFTDADICDIHRVWLGDIYEWAGAYRNVNISKGGLMFAAAGLVPGLMVGFERGELRTLTPCNGMSVETLIAALARTHAELILIHPFREGNGRCARLLAWLMALQAGLPPLDFRPLAGRGRPAYFAAIRAAFGKDYRPLGSAVQNGYRPDFAALRGAVVILPVRASRSKGLRMPSIAEDDAAEIRRAAARAFGSRRYGLVFSSEALIK